MRFIDKATESAAVMTILRSRDRLRGVCKDASQALDVALTDHIGLHTNECKVVLKEEYDFDDCTCWQAPVHRVLIMLEEAGSEA